MCVNPAAPARPYPAGWGRGVRTEDKDRWVMVLGYVFIHTPYTVGSWFLSEWNVALRRFRKCFFLLFLVRHE